MARENPYQSPDAVLASGKRQRPWKPRTMKFIVISCLVTYAAAIVLAFLAYRFGVRRSVVMPARDLVVQIAELGLLVSVSIYFRSKLFTLALFISILFFVNRQIIQWPIAQYALRGEVDAGLWSATLFWFGIGMTRVLASGWSGRLFKISGSGTALFSSCLFVTYIWLDSLAIFAMLFGTVVVALQFVTWCSAKFGTLTYGNDRR